jgi:hypothetical protein
MPSETSNIFEVQPIYECLVGREEESDAVSDPVMLMQILQQDPNDPNNDYWYAQVSDFLTSRYCFLFICVYCAGNIY